jgi:hypothetical protein
MNEMQRLGAAKRGSFHDRFNIHLDQAAARRRFVNRCQNEIWDNFFEHDVSEKIKRGRVLWRIANALGEVYDWDAPFDRYVRDFFTCLEALEAAYAALDSKKNKARLESLILYVISVSESDLGVIWRGGKFLRTGAALMDKTLINDTLSWLEGKNFSVVHQPFEKGLSLLLQSTRNPKLLNDVVTDMYEALEAFVKIITRRPNKDLSASAELFLSQLKVSGSYKRILKEYVAYANLFRHGQAEQTSRPNIGIHEAESFVYLTGVFIRLGIVVEEHSV